MKIKTTFGQLATAAAAALSVLAAVTSGAKAQPIELAFFYHLDAEMPEQDVFVAKEGSGVFRVTGGDTDMNAALFTTATGLHHNPFDPAQVGPHAKGADMGMTLGQWLGATGTGSYECSDGTAKTDIDFTGLVPGGVYTMWHFFMPMPATDPFTGTIDLPFGARDGADSTFIADDKGTAAFTRVVDGCLQMSGSQLVAGLAISYHSDGKTYGSLPGEFGHNSHVQLFTILPN